MTADLIDRLEKATGPSEELDAEIAVLIGIKHRTRRTAMGQNKGREWLQDSHGGVETWERKPPAFTDSLDAAMTLVPKNYRLAELQDLLLGRWCATVREIHSTADGGSSWKNFEAEASTGPLALCIASVKAWSHK